MAFQPAPEANPPRPRANRQHDTSKEDVGFMYYVPGPNRDKPPLPPAAYPHGPGQKSSR